jgi:hypothetical protein
VAAIRHGVLFLSQPVIRFLTEARASVSFILSQHAWSVLMDIILAFAVSVVNPAPTAAAVKPP